VSGLAPYLPPTTAGSAVALQGWVVLPYSVTLGPNSEAHLGPRLFAQETSLSSALPLQVMPFWNLCDC
jgi:hypothetical protein